MNYNYNIDKKCNIGLEGEQRLIVQEIEIRKAKQNIVTNLKRKIY